MYKALIVEFFNIHSIFFVAFGQSISYLEFFGVVSGGIAVYLSARSNVWSWPLGLINVTLLFFLFFQVQLYPDMFLQIFFFITNLIGWWRWTHPLQEEEDRRKQLKVSYSKVRILIAWSGIGIMVTILMGALASQLHHLFPILFSQPSAFPYADSFITVMSILATYLMVNKKIECWMMWILIDAIATVLYSMKDLKLVGIEYLVFCFIAAFGLWNWMQVYKSYSHP